MLTVKSYLLPTASDCKQRLSKGCQNVSLLRPILKAHFRRKQCANDNPTTQVVFTYNCFETIVRLIYKVRFALEVYRKHITRDIGVVQCESVFR